MQIRCETRRVEEAEKVREGEIKERKSLWSDFSPLNMVQKRKPTLAYLQITESFTHKLSVPVTYTTLVTGYLFYLSLLSILDIEKDSPLPHPLTSLPYY